MVSIHLHSVKTVFTFFFKFLSRFYVFNVLLFFLNFLKINKMRDRAALQVS